MNHYQRSLMLDAEPAQVYAALSTPAGLRGWWTQDCDVATAIGETSRFRFGRHHKAMLVEQLDPNHDVRWLCTGAHIAAPELTRPDEWVGTRIVFRLTAQEAGRTRVDFEHVGLVPEMECFGMCSRGWNYFLESLQAFVRTGHGTPYAIEQAVAA